MIDHNGAVNTDNIENLMAFSNSDRTSIRTMMPEQKEGDEVDTDSIGGDSEAIRQRKLYRK